MLFVDHKSIETQAGQCYIFVHLIKAKLKKHAHKESWGVLLKAYLTEVVYLH